jgi:hypothetical protein
MALGRCSGLFSEGVICITFLSILSNALEEVGTEKLGWQAQTKAF